MKNLQIPFAIFGEIAHFSPHSPQHVTYKLPRWTVESEPISYDDFLAAFGSCPIPGSLNLTINDLFTTQP